MLINYTREIEFIDHVSNILDFLLFLIFIRTKVVITAGRKKFLYCTALFFIEYLLMDCFPLPLAVILPFLFISQILYTKMISSADFPKAFLLSTAFFALVMTADECTFFITFLLKKLISENLFQSVSGLLYEKGIYYIVLFPGLFLHVHNRLANFSLPPSFSMMGLISIIIEIIFFYTQIDLANQLGESNLMLYPIITSLFLNLLFFLIMIMVIQFGKLCSDNFTIRTESLKAEQQIKEAETYKETAKILRVWKHDFHNQLLTLSEFAEKENWKALTDYLSDLLSPSANHPTTTSGGNLLADTILCLKKKKAIKENIDFESTVFIPAVIPLPQIEFSSLLSNLLDNAIEGCIKLDEGRERKITLYIAPNQGGLSISLTNTSNGQYLIDSCGNFLSTKQDREHGIGLSRVTSIVSEHNGKIQIIPTREHFTVRVYIPLPQDDSPVTHVSFDSTHK